jgi:hypothetical protein
MSARTSLLLQLDGKLPNLALMRLSAFLKQQGKPVEFRRISSALMLEQGLFDDVWEGVYASLIFERTRPIAQRLREIYPGAVIGGTGWNLTVRLEDIGVSTTGLDYSLYPRYSHSIGFTQQEGAISQERPITEIWRGDPYSRNVLLLDNDFFGARHWRDRIDELRAGDFRVCFSQGINARLLDDETAAALASVRYFDDDFQCRRIYTAWDNKKDEARLFAGLNALVKHGVKPREILVYMLIGYWPGETHEDREYRRRSLREFGCLPYPMPYQRSRELVGFQRWVVRRADLRISWEEYSRAQFRPERVVRSDQNSLFEILP